MAKATVYNVNMEDAKHPIMKTQDEMLKNTKMEKGNRIDDEGSTTLDQDILDPPYENKLLILLCEQSSILQQCIDAYKTNIAGFGLEAQSRVDTTVLKEAEKNAVEKEVQELSGYLNYINLETPIEEVIEAVEDDLEKTGNGYFEILRSDDGEISTFEHLPSDNMRICKKDKESQTIDREVEINGVVKKKSSQKTFRRYVQVVGLKKVYFKEYGHPLDLDMKTGEYSDHVDYNDRASEVLHIKIGNDTYGKPRWIGNVISALGARKAEELNFYYFQNGRHLPAAITVSNGMLDQQSKDNLEGYMKNAQGVENAHKFLLLEAMGDTTESNTGEEKVTPAKVDVKDLAQVIQQDALFLEYDKETRKKIRSSFRLPPIYTGEAEEYNRATSDTAREITEEQVFQPERKKIARRLNSVLLPELGIYKAKLAFKNADFRDPKELAKLIQPFIDGGAASPNDLRPLLGEILGVELDEWDEFYDRPVVLGRRGDTEVIDEIRSGEIQKSDDKVAHILKDVRDVLLELKNEQD